MNKLNGNTFSYIASGCNYTRVTYQPDIFDSNPELKNFVSNAFTKMQTIGDNHTFALLFNGWTELGIGQLLERFKDDVPDIYADSGGLQVYTQGKKITEDLKIDVYKTQAKYSSKAFIFDEQPIGSYNSGNLSKHDMSNRWFDHENLSKQAKLTGKNVAKQLDTFIQEDSDTKSMLILHGNCLSSYQETLDHIMNEIPKERHDMIGGIAMAGGALGGGILEDVKRIFYFSQLNADFDIKQLHILGFGSIKRSFPFIIFAQNGLFKNLNISYDSTTHTSGLTQGRHWMDMKQNEMKIGKLKNNDWEKMYQNVTDNFDLNISFDDYYQYCLESSYKRIIEKYKDGSEHIKCYFATAMTGMINFIRAMEEFIQDEKKVKSWLMNNHKLRHLAYLYEVKNLDDFKHWENQHGKYLTSHPVLPKKDSLEEFFG